MSETVQNQQATAGPPSGEAVGPGAAPATAAPVGPPPAAPAPKRKPPVVMIGIVSVGLLVGGYFGWGWWQHRQAFVSTDDAQVAGDLISVSARVPGHIATLMVDEGAQVKQGQVIAKLDDTDFKAAVQQSEAALAVAKSNLASSQTGVTLQGATNGVQISQAQAGVAAANAGIATASAATRTASAALQNARANALKANQDVERTRKLFAVGGISRQALDAAEAAAATGNAGVAQAQGQLASAQAQLQSAQAQLQNAHQTVAMAQANTQQIDIKRGGVQNVQAQILQAEAALATAKLQLAHATIYAPANGIVARRMSNVGEQVSPGQGIFSVAKTDNIWVLGYVEETEVRRVRQDAPVEVHIDAFPKQTFKGHVSLVNVVTGAQFSLLPQNNAAGNYTKVVQRIPIKIAVDDPNHMLKPGMSAIIDIEAHNHQ